MLFPNINRDDIENLDKLVSLQNKVHGIRLQDKRGKQIFQYIRKKAFEPVSDIVKDVSKYVAKIVKEISKENNKALSN